MIAQGRVSPTAVVARHLANPTYAPIINEDFTLTDEEIAQWRQMIEFMAQQVAGVGALG